MNDNNEKIYRIELTNEEYEFLENIKNELKHKLSKMNKEELIEYFKSLCPEENLNFEKQINGKKVQEVDIYYRGVGIISFPVSLDDIEITIEKILNKKTA